MEAVRVSASSMLAAPRGAAPRSLGASLGALRPSALRQDVAGASAAAALAAASSRAHPTPAAAARHVSVRAMASGDTPPPTPSGRIISGPCYVLEDNIDTDQIIPAEFLTLVPSVPEEYEKLGSYALCGLPEAHLTRYIKDGEMKTEYPIIVAGANFGCGSSREHAPVALGAAGCRAVVAESYARIFFRNCVATGELYPVDVAPEYKGTRLCDAIKTGDIVTVDLEHDLLIHEATGTQYPLAPIGEAGPVIDAGGIFNFARSSGMIASKA